MSVKFADLVEEPDVSVLPPLDQGAEPLDDVQRSWQDNGYVVLEKFLPDELIDPYVAAHEQQYGSPAWPSTTTYMLVDECRNLCLYRPLTQTLKWLIGDDMGLHLNLSGWTTTGRNWHQDDYLNPPFVNCWYAAVWFALEDIRPESGPFQFVPGSHKWALLRRDKVLAQLDVAERSDPMWPKYTERFLTEACEEEIAARGANVETFHAKKGDVLIWHGRLLHRGSDATVEGTQRKALIAHYSARSRREDMPDSRYIEGMNGLVGGWYFNLPVW